MASAISNEAIVAAVIDFAGRMPGAQHPSDCGAGTPLADGGFALDSLALVELLMACEDRFGIRLQGSELTPERLLTAGSLAALIQSRLTIDPSRS